MPNARIIPAIPAIIALVLLFSTVFLLMLPLLDASRSGDTSRYRVYTSDSCPMLSIPYNYITIAPHCPDHPRLDTPANRRYKAF
jgi:hypothetical protein